MAPSTIDIDRPYIYIYYSPSDSGSYRLYYTREAFRKQKHMARFIRWFLPNYLLIKVCLLKQRRLRAAPKDEIVKVEYKITEATCSREPLAQLAYFGEL